MFAQVESSRAAGINQLMNQHLSVADRLYQSLRRDDRKIVFAESCTAGLVAATMGRIAGVSDCLCGSMVTYRNEAKIGWLGIDEQDLATQTAVSQSVTEAMARNVLRRTPDAFVSAAVTGHFGPGAPAELDGVVFISVATRSSEQITTQRVSLISVDRAERQVETVDAVLSAALAAVS